MGGGYTHQTKGTGMALAAEINKMKVEIDALRRAIANLGIQIDTVDGKLVIASGRSLEVDGSETVGGSLSVTGTQTVGGTLNVTGDETVGGTLDVTGNMIVGGTLSLPDGIINNAALASPVTADYGWSQASNYAIGTGNPPGTLAAVRSSFTIPVPAGFSRALVLAMVTDDARNSTSSTGTLGSYVSIAKTSGGTPFEGYGPAADVPAGAFGFSAANAVGLVTGLASGDSITVASRPYVLSGTWAANTGNSTAPAATAIFLR